VKRREYKIDIEFNDIRIKKVIIDPHYEEKHSSSINDEIILQLVHELDGEVLIPDDIDPPFSYFSHKMSLNGKLYKLIWLLEDNHIYIGVVNVYRRK
jgi:hypothetical protein